MSIIDFLIRGYLDWPWWAIILYLLGVTHLTIACVTIYLHRGQAHLSVKLHRFPEHCARFWLWLTTGMVTIEWQSIHRKHHANCETVGDPHSPQIYGIEKVLCEGAELYRAEAKNPETLRKHGHGAPNDWIERNLYSRHVKLGISLMLVIDVLLFGAVGLSVWAIQMAWIPVMAAGVINGLGHYWGYRNFSSPDQSTNISPWGILIGGEELHNNHHTYPTSAKLSVERHEFDIGWAYIRLLELMGLAKVKRDRLAPRLVYSIHANTLEETAKVVIELRFEMLRELDGLLEVSSGSKREFILKLREEFTVLWEDEALTTETQAQQFSLWCKKAGESGVLWLDGVITTLPYMRVERG